MAASTAATRSSTRSDCRGDTSDARCVLAAYAKWGDAFAEKLNGDFALALYDPAARRIILARDALGIRPLYYFRSDRLFAFASEIKALLAHPDIPTAPSMEGVADFMMIGVRPIDKQDVTCFEGVFSLVPAHLLVATPERIVTRRYWDFDGGLSDSAVVRATSTVKRSGALRHRRPPPHALARRRRRFDQRRLRFVLHPLPGADAQSRSRALPGNHGHLVSRHGADRG